MHTAGSQGINMLNTLRIKPMLGARLPRVAAALLLLAASAAAMAADVSFGLWAKSGSATLPGGSAVTVWGYADSASAPLSKPGGPVLIVNQGDNVTVNLTNGLAAASGLLFQGQSLAPDTAGTTAAGGTKTYTFTASNPGTFLYEAALLPGAQYQAAMGLYGALIVRPTAVAPRIDAGTTVVNASTLVLDAAAQASDLGSSVSGTDIPAGASITAVNAGVSFTMSVAATGAGDGTVVVTRVAAYADAATAYNDEAVLVLSEIDPALNGSANPAGFDMRNYAPQYFLINGKTYPDTDPIASAPGHRALLRYVNAGVKHHSMAVLGLRQNFVSKDGSLLPTLSHNVASETLAPGQTADAIAPIPATVTTLTRFAVYDANLMLRSGSAAGFGGMLTFVNAGTGTAPTGPVVSALALAGSALTATITAGTGQTVQAAEYWIDAGAHAPLSVATPATSVNVSATIPAQSSGSHTVYVRGQDNANVWGAPKSVHFVVDTTGPVTSGLTLTPNPSNGAVAVALSATANDSTTGNSNVTAAEYTVDGGAATPMLLNVANQPVASVSATIAAGLPAGAHTVAVRSQDAAGNWGAPATITLTVVTSAPVTSAVGVARTPNNGALPLSSSQAVVRVSATVTSAGSTIGAAEAFIDSVGAPGSGFPFVPSDGAWNAASESVYGDIALANIAALSNGNHTIHVRGKDALGSWGTTSTAILVIDKVAPTISASSLSASTVAFGTASVTLSITAADNTGGVGLGIGQYWIDGSATPPVSPIAIANTGGTINTSALAGGTHTVYYRVQDLATNASTVSSATLTVLRAVADAYTTTIANNNAGNNRVQSITVSSGAGVLANDQPTGVAARTATPLTPAVTRISNGTGTGLATMTVSLASNGGFTYTLTVPNSVIGNANIRAAKRGAYQFTYTETLNGVTSNATVAITVN
jgi:Multicopper oxidase